MEWSYKALAVYRTRSTQHCNSCPLSFLSATWLPVLAGKAFGTSSIQAGVMALSIQSSPQGTLHTSGGPSRNQLSSLWTSPGPPAGRWQTGGSVVAGRAYLKEETTLHRGNCLVNQSKWKSTRTCVCGKPLNIGDNSQKKIGNKTWIIILKTEHENKYTLEYIQNYYKLTV